MDARRGDVEGDAVAFALCRPNAESAMRAPWTTLRVEEEESRRSRTCAVVRDAFPVVGSARWGGTVGVPARGAREERDASGGAAVLVRRDRVRENPLMVDVYERRDAMGTLMLKHAGRDLFDWLRSGRSRATSTASTTPRVRMGRLVGPSDGFSESRKSCERVMRRRLDDRAERVSDDRSERVCANAHAAR